MTGIAGWTGRPGRPGQDVPPERILDHMLNAGFRHPGAMRKQASDGERALGVQGRPEICDVCYVGAALAVVYGRPVWTDDALAARARDQGNAAALLDAWHRRGTDLFGVLHGQAAIAVVDGGRREALIAIDRVGIHQMCYAPASDGETVFATDARAVAAHPSVAAELSPQALFDYFYFNVSPGPDTVFTGVRKLLAGQYAHLRDGLLGTGFYWQPPYAEPEKADADEAARALRACLEDSVARADPGDGVATGAFLSGGLDSSTVAGLLSKRRAAPKCFTISFSEDRYNELPWAADAARHFGAEHIVHELTPGDTADTIPALAAAHDEPHGNSSAVPACVCARVARRAGVETLLAGDGGDEIFAGNERYAEQARYESWLRLPRLLRGVAGGLLRLAASPTGTGLLARARFYTDRAAMGLPARLQAYNPLERLPAGDLFDRAFLARVDTAAPRRVMRETYARPGGISELKRMHYLDLQITLADNDLRKVGRACEIAGLDVRYPMLDEELVSLAARIPSALLLPDGRLRGFYKDAMADFLPRRILDKPKHGFGMPFVDWLHRPGPLRDMAAEAVAAFGKRGILRDGMADRLAGGGPAGLLDGAAWDILVLETWLQANESVATLR